MPARILPSPSASHFVVELVIFRREGGEPVHVAVVHAEGGGDKHGIVDFEIGSPFGAGAGNILCGDSVAALLHLAGDGQKSLHFGADWRALIVEADGIDDCVVTLKMMSRRRPMARLAKIKSFRDETNVAIISRSPPVKVLGPRSNTSARARIGSAVSGRKANALLIPGSPSANSMWGMVSSFETGWLGLVERSGSKNHL
jgi:hypothetical protein